MKTDIDALMSQRNLDALLVLGPGDHNPPMVYLTGGAHLTDAYLVKKRGAAPVLCHYPMERDEAARTGLQTLNLATYRLDEIRKQVNGDLPLALAMRLQKIFHELGLTKGRVGIYGRYDAGQTFAVFSVLQKIMPEIEILGEVEDSVFLAAMSTKDDNEAGRIRRMGEVTTQVVSRVADYLTSQRVKDELLVKPDGAPLTIGDVKRLINLWLAESGAENPEGTIFAIGRDAGVPHSSGTASDPLRLGQTIIFDIFPCEAGGGYFYDFTRTWCLGYAPDEVWKLYEDVRAVFLQVMSELRAGALCRQYQELTCDLFAARGHPTLKDNPLTENGYVHSIGHGLGLYVHERPMMRMTSPDHERLDPGVVVTIEPGLYYPERGMGVRLEDSVYVRPDGTIEVLAEYPLDLVLPMKP